MRGLYKYEYNGEIIYIGKSDSSIEKRISAHEHENKFQPYLSKAKIYYSICKNAAETTILETYLINKHKPILNISMKYNDKLNIEIPEPDWQKYTSEIIAKLSLRKETIVKRTKIWFDNRYKKIKDLQDRIDNLLRIKNLIEPYNGQYDIVVSLPNTTENEVYKTVHGIYNVRYKNGGCYLCQLVNHIEYDEENIVINLLSSELLMPQHFWDNYRTVFAGMISEHQKEIKKIQKEIECAVLK